MLFEHIRQQVWPQQLPSAGGKITASKHQARLQILYQRSLLPLVRRCSGLRWCRREVGLARRPIRRQGGFGRLGN